MVCPTTIGGAPAEVHGSRIAVAVNVTGGKPETVASMVLAPTVGPRIQLPTVATPLAFVVAVPPVTLPPPPVTAKVTLAPATPLPRASLSLAAGGTGTARPIGEVWPLPLLVGAKSSVVAGPASAIALKEVNENEPVTDTVTICATEVFDPIVQVVDARPSVPGVTLGVPTDPDPDVTTNATVRPAMAPPSRSTTRT